MNVLVLHSELGVLRGGGENFTRNLFTAFAERGNRVWASFVADLGAKYPIELPSCIQPIPIRGWWSRKFGQATFSSVGRHLPFQTVSRAKWDHLQEAICWRTIRWHNRRFCERIEREFRYRWGKFDAVYVHGDISLASRVARHRPTVLRLLGPVSSEVTEMLCKVHVICANGDALAQTRGLLGDRVVELPIGLDRELFRPGATAVRSELGWDARHRVVGYVGRLTRLKGVDLLATAFREVSGIGVDARLLIVGSGEEEHNLRTILAKELARGIVHIEPDASHAQLPQWYRAMDLLVMPSRYENFSNALLEAMACGTPFLASAVGGNNTLGEMGAGWLFEPESIPALSSRLRTIMENHAEMKTRGEIGSRYARRCGSWAASAERLEKIIA